MGEGANQRAIVLLSGGLDSATTLAIARARGFDVHALSFTYGQRAAVEVSAAGKVAKALGAVDHKIVDIDLRQFGGSALTADIAVPKGRSAAEMDDGIPITYVPARNTVFLSFALALAEVVGTGDIFIGVNAVDYSGYPDCRPDYIAAFQAMANLALKSAVEGQTPVTIHAPLMDFSKAEIIRKGVELGVDFSLTVSCYDPSDDGAACGACDSCALRRDGFTEAGVDDPTLYASQS